MEKPILVKEMKSFESSSPLELDRRFWGEQSWMSALSLDQLSTSRASIDTAAECFDPRLSVLASLGLSADPLSPSQSFSVTSAQEVESCHLSIPLLGKSSTPHVLLQKQKKLACSDQSYSELVSSQMSWDVSFIKPESNSPKPRMESSDVEPMMSPTVKCGLNSQAVNP